MSTRSMNPTTYGQTIHPSTLGELLTELMQQTYDLFHKNLELAKAELQEEGRKISKVTVYGIMGLIFSIGLVMFAGGLLVLLLFSAGLPAWAAMLIVTGVFLILSLLMLFLGYRGIKKLYP